MNIDLSGEPRKVTIQRAPEAVTISNLPPFERGLEQKADQVTLEMSRYIDLNLYHAVERTHPYYVEMVDHMCGIVRNLVAKNSGKPLRILEIGAGTGLFTESLLQIENVTVDALELDSECHGILKTHLSQYIQEGRLNPIQGDGVVYTGKGGSLSDGPYDVVMSCFAHDHIHYERAEAFAKNIRRNLKKGGHYVMGGEILPKYSNDQERWESLHQYHGFIIEKALRDGHYALAQIEINALKSGIEMEGDFKRHEELFEKEMLSDAFTLHEKAKMGPSHRNDIGGVFVYDFVAV